MENHIFPSVVFPRDTCIEFVDIRYVALPDGNGRVEIGQTNCDSVDGKVLHQLRNGLSHLLGFQPSKVMQDFLHPQTNDDIIVCMG